MAGYSNVGSTTSGSSRRTSSTGGRAGSGALSKTVSVSSNSEVNSAETSSGGSFSCMTRTSSGGSEGAVAAAAASSSSVPKMGLRRSGSGAGGKKKRFVGVRQRPSGRWVAEIKDTTQKIRLWLGTFDTAEDAARAYDEAAWLLRGANTRTNFVPGTKTEAPALPSKAARLLQLRRNAAAVQSGNSRREREHPPRSLVGCKSGVLSRSQGNSTPASPEIHLACVPSSVVASEIDNNLPSAPKRTAGPSHTDDVRESDSENFSMEASKSESSGLQSSVEEMCGLEESPAPEHNATSGLSTGLANRSDQETQFHGAGVSCRSEIIVKQEVLGEYCKLGESSAIKENRKEKDYCSETPQERLVDDADMSSGLSGLDDVDLNCEDSVYSSAFDFSADMGSGLDLGNFGSGPLSSDEDSTFFPDPMRRLFYERQISAGLYPMNGGQENLSPSHGSWGSAASSFGMSSPSLTLTAGFRRSTSGPFLTASPVLWKTSSNVSNGTTSWGTPVSNSSAASAGNGSGESVESPREDALWQSMDLPPLCVVA